ncbi:hypothetical protein AB0D33_13535 [Streptomyces sp. NPDC048404]|uniref:hypothetical protein n=1 Tax=unclassified Streptomyces TaxID=2593676 RepID=UPI00342E380C
MRVGTYTSFGRSWGVAGPPTTVASRASAETCGRHVTRPGPRAAKDAIWAATWNGLVWVTLRETTTSPMSVVASRSAAVTTGSSLPRTRS